MTKTFKAVIWDFGGVFTSSPFDAFARYEAEQGLPRNFIRTVNATNPLDNAWAQLEQSKVSGEE
ncbi:MAG: HAD family hydrolase, partial [Hyphomonas sp.]